MIFLRDKEMCLRKWQMDDGIEWTFFYRDKKGVDDFLSEIAAVIVCGRSSLIGISGSIVKKKRWKPHKFDYGRLIMQEASRNMLHMLIDGFHAFYPFFKTYYS